MALEKRMSLSKICIHCGNEFVINRTSFGRGSANSIKRRVFCGPVCKNAYGRNRVEGKIEQICAVCRKVFLRFPSHPRVYCSHDCKILSQFRVAVSTCKHCGKNYQAHPARLNEFYCSRQCFHEAGREKRICITCHKQFTAKKSCPNVRCSRQCQYIDQSNGRIKIHLNGRSGFRADLGSAYYFKSALEADFARTMNYLGIQFNYESKTFQTAHGAYTPDFYLPEFDTFVELKGVQNINTTYSQMMTKNLTSHTILREQKYKIITVTQKEFINALKDAKLWGAIPNLEQRSYKKTAYLVTKHENKTTTSHPTFPTSPTD
jgi:hypothetical protein